MCVDNKLKQVVGFDKYLISVKRPPSRLFLKFGLSTHGLFEELVGMLTGVSPRNALIVEFVKSLLIMFFLSMHHTIPRAKNFLDYLKQVLTLKAFEAFVTVAFQ